MTIMTPLPRMAPAHPALTALQSFATVHAAALISAAGLLGGRPAVRRTAHLLEDLLGTTQLTRRLRRELAGLHRLLSLESVDDEESLEAACFSGIDPASPIVDEICLLSDGLLARLLALPDTQECEYLSELAAVA